MTLEQLVARLRASAGHLHKWEAGKVSVNLKRMGEIADILKISVVDLVDEPPRVPIVGKVSAGAQVESIDDFPLGKAPKYGYLPTGMDSRYTGAVEVVGDSMLPTH